MLMIQYLKCLWYYSGGGGNNAGPPGMVISPPLLSYVYLTAQAASTSQNMAMEMYKSLQRLPFCVHRSGTFFAVPGDVRNVKYLTVHDESIQYILEVNKIK